MRPSRAKRMCGTKKKHASWIAAYYAADAATKEFKVEFNYYPCPYCDGWHIGRSKKGNENEQR